MYYPWVQGSGIWEHLGGEIPAQSLSRACNQDVGRQLQAPLGPSVQLTHGALGWRPRFFPMDPAMGQTVSSQSGNSFPPSKILMSKVKAEAVLSSVIWSREPRISLPSLSTCQKRSPKCSKQNRALLLNGRACEGEAMLTVRDVRVGMEASGILEISVVSAPLCHEPKTALESKAD